MNRMLTLVALMGWGALVLAGGPTVTMKPVTSFGYLDTDKDMRVSLSEAQADWAVAQGFERADADRDGYLDKAEFATLSRG